MNLIAHRLRKMGMAREEYSPRSSEADDSVDDETEAGSFNADNDTMAPLFRQRRRVRRDENDDSTCLVGNAPTMPVYVTIHRYALD
jgi:hypothetical protein